MKSQSLKRFLRWSVRIAGFVILLLGTFVLVEHVRGRVLLSRIKAELRGQGEKLTLAELDLPKPPVEGNGAADLLAAADELKSRQKDWPLAADGISASRMVGPGLSLVAWQRERMFDPRAPSAAPIERDWSELAAELTAAGPILDRALFALQQPVLAMDLEYDLVRMRLEHLAKVRLLARWFVAAAVADLRANNLDAAVEKLAAILRLNHFLEHDRLIISELVRYAVAGIAFDLTWAALQAEGWTHEQLSRLQRAWEAERSIAALAPAMETERALKADMFVRLRDRQVLQGIVPENAISFPRWLVWRFAWSDQAECSFLCDAQRLIQCARRIEAERAFLACGESPDENSWAIDTAYDGWRGLFSGFYSILKGPLRHAARCQVQREMALAAIALKRHELIHGALPASLEALVPEFLSELPRDYMNAQPLRYRPNEDGTFLLYSIGDDGVDDGGNPMPREGETLFWMWKARDAVWPKPVTQSPETTLSSTNESSTVVHGHSSTR